MAARTRGQKSLGVGPTTKGPGTYTGMTARAVQGRRWRRDCSRANAKRDGMRGGVAAASAWLLVWSVQREPELQRRPRLSGVAQWAWGSGMSKVAGGRGPWHPILTSLGAVQGEPDGTSRSPTL